MSNLNINLNPHNRLVVGSIPTGPTRFFLWIKRSVAENFLQFGQSVLGHMRHRQLALRFFYFL